RVAAWRRKRPHGQSPRGLLDGIASDAFALLTDRSIGFESPARGLRKKREPPFLHLRPGRPGGGRSRLLGGRSRSATSSERNRARSAPASSVQATSTFQFFSDRT